MEVCVEEVQVLVPIECGDVMPAGANVIRHVASMDGTVHQGHLGGDEAADTQQGVHATGAYRGEKFAARIGPLVLDGARDVDRSGRKQRERRLPSAGMC